MRAWVAYGGTFDPIHRGHVAVACAVRDRLDVDVRLVPAADPPHKPATHADAAQRRRMVELAVAGEPRLCVDARELGRDAPSYSVDTLAMFANDYAHSGAQEKVARLVVTAPVQQQYNAAKGSVPVRRDASTAGMDSCARASWTAFARGPAVQVPSLVHRMATAEESRDVIIAEVRRYFVDDSVPAAQVQKRLATVFRTFTSRLNAKP